MSNPILQLSKDGAPLNLAALQELVQTLLPAIEPGLYALLDLFLPYNGEPTIGTPYIPADGETPEVPATPGTPARLGRLAVDSASSRVWIAINDDLDGYAYPTVWQLIFDPNP